MRPGPFIAFVECAALMAVFACAERRDRSIPGQQVKLSEPPRGDVNKEPLPVPLDSPQVIVAKGKRELRLYAGGKLVRIYRVGLGFDPVADKVRQGDGRTPEGEFYVCSKNAQSKYYLSLGLSYPNDEDAARGLRDGLITRSQYQAIVGAIRSKGRPPWDTRLGGEIFIHGEGASSDWTLGCVALENEDMKELFHALPKGTPVIIKP